MENAINAGKMQNNMRNVFLKSIILNNRLCGGVNGNSVKFLCIFERAIFFFLKEQCNVLQNRRLMRIQA